MDGTGIPIRSLQRSRGVVRTGFRDGALSRLFQSGSAKALLPRTYGAADEVVFVNTAGGVTGGDVYTYECEAEGGAVIITTQAAERAYKSSGDEPARLDVKLAARNGASLYWLPQETILFDHSRLARRIEIDIDNNSECLILESAVFGRHAMGEALRTCYFTDSWRLRRDGALIHAEAQRLDRDIEHCIGSAAGANGSQMMAVLVYAGPHSDRMASDIGAALGNVRSRGALSSWGGKVVMRLLAEDTMTGKQDIARILTAMRGLQVPRVWQ